MPLFEALASARNQGLDLVEVAPTSMPPVCKIMDYGRFKYEQTKKEREQHKTQKMTVVKEVRMRPRTDEHDVNVKVRTIEGFLEDGQKVKVAVTFKGREMAHPELGRRLLEQIVASVGALAHVERAPILEGKNLLRTPEPQPRLVVGEGRKTGHAASRAAGCPACGTTVRAAGRSPRAAERSARTGAGPRRTRGRCRAGRGCRASRAGSTGCSRNGPSHGRIFREAAQQTTGA